MTDVISSDAQDTDAIARGAFAEIARRFPALRMVENSGEPVEISITMPVQPGLSHEVWLCLQNCDELHFAVSHFWCEWFPCTKRDRVDRFVDAVIGFLSGKYRVLEHYRGTRCFKAQLQKPKDEGWQTIATWWSALWFLWPWSKTLKEIRNA